MYCVHFKPLELYEKSVNVAVLAHMLRFIEDKYNPVFPGIMSILDIPKLHDLINNKEYPFGRETQSTK